MKRLKLLFLPWMIVSLLVTLLMSAGGVEAASSAWRIVPSPSPGSLGSLNGVAILSTNDGWAVGNYLSRGDQPKTLTEHWNGTRWKIVPSPNAGDYNILNTVSALASGFALATGTDGTISGSGHTLAEVNG